MGQNIPGRYLGLAVETTAGPMFENGLAKLKRVVEAAAARARTTATHER